MSSPVAGIDPHQNTFTVGPRSTHSGRIPDKGRTSARATHLTTSGQFQWSPVR